MAGADGFDAVVVGSGPNGLIGATMLAEAGLRVLLLEGAEEFGGGLRSAPLTLDGFTHDICATVLPLARASAAFRDLDLKIEWSLPQVQAAHPLDGQDAVLVRRDIAETAAGQREDGGAHVVGEPVQGERRAAQAAAELFRAFEEQHPEPGFGQHGGADQPVRP